MPANSMGTFDVTTVTVANASGSDIAAYLRVKQVAGGANGIPNVAPAGATDNAIGSTRKPIANGGRGTVMLEGSGGMHIGTAAGAIGDAVAVFATAGGKL